MNGKKVKLATFMLGIISAAILIMLVGLQDESGNEGFGFDRYQPDQNAEDYQEHYDENGEENLVGLGTRAAPGNDPCFNCHQVSGIMNGVMKDWEGSAHAEYDVSCIDCHEADPSDVDAISHNGYYMSPVVSPLDCAECHSQEVQEFDQSLHSFGVDYYEILYNKGKLPFIESHGESGFLMVDGEVMDHAATLRGCQGCHGTNMTGKSVDDFTVWPNNGIGRINPDGSKGSCSSCHSRHSFSVEEARKPETCGQCHMGPDHPQIEIYMESKHGNIYASEGDTWNWTSDTWEAGVDYRAPTCTVCHMSAAPGVPVTHDVSSRLSWELESPLSRRTDNIANSLGVEFSDGSTWQEKQSRMQSVCEQCHSGTWVENYYEQADLAVELYNEQYSASKVVVDKLYEDGLLTPVSFDEPIEFEIYEMWHHEGRRARMGAFMMGPDYVQWHGFYDVLIDKVEIEHMAEEIRAKALEENEEQESFFLVTNGFDDKVHLRWMFFDSMDVDHYNIYWSKAAITDVSGLTPNATATEDLKTVGGLADDTTYYFAVAAVNGTGSISSTAFSHIATLQSDDTDDDGEQTETNKEDIGDLESSVSKISGGLAVGIIVVFLISFALLHFGLLDIKQEIDTLKNEGFSTKGHSVDDFKPKKE